MDIQVKTDLKKLQKKMGVLQHKTFNKVLSEGMNYTGAKVVNAHRQMLLKKLEKPKKTSITAITMSQFAKPNKRGLKVLFVLKAMQLNFCIISILERMSLLEVKVIHHPQMMVCPKETSLET